MSSKRKQRPPSSESDKQEHLREAVRSLERELVCIESASEMVTALDQLTADESDFLCHRDCLLDAWRKGNLYTMRIKETDQLFKDHELRLALGNFLGVTPSWLNLPVLCWCIDGDDCKILWVAKHVRRLGLRRDLVRSLGIKRASHVLDQSRGFWERIGVSI